jgi:hypothetical protein
MLLLAFERFAIFTEKGLHNGLSERCKTVGRGFGLVVRAAGWHAGNPGSILGRDGLHAFG